MRNVKLDRDISEEELVKLTLQKFREAKIKQAINEKAMSTMKFPYGTLVVKKTFSRLDGIMGNTDNNHGELRVGIIVGNYLLDGIVETLGGYPPKDMYRVHYDDTSQYIGEHVDYLEIYEGPVPDHLKDVSWNDIYFLGFNM